MKRKKKKANTERKKTRPTTKETDLIRRELRDNKTRDTIEGPADTSARHAPLRDHMAADEEAMPAEAKQDLAP